MPGMTVTPSLAASCRPWRLGQLARRNYTAPTRPAIAVSQCARSLVNLKGLKSFAAESQYGPPAP